MSLTIRRTHPLVKLAYLFNGGAPNEHYDYEARCYKIRPTSLCVIFWRCVGSLVGVLGFSTLVIALLALVAVKLYHVPWSTWKIVLEVVLAAAMIGGSIVGSCISACDFIGGDGWRWWRIDTEKASAHPSTSSVTA